ncbi:C4-dicarboxylate ABC transporter [Conexibacter arvalis]|uniref:Tellurite resistance protein TehA-like permease n=1 Tax=Conexibacter arvalis TaxID=912552 RepID=A0A840ICB3_9ACTN|nr:C4-dicarboxylate ABC transporter [Conexibacter arvalis]MBB4661965.1 tellurite resistance protein TehA-like permease [Conexibacter arvalis]
MRVAPNWFTVTMGTGIVANAAALLPVDLPGLRALALAAWVAAALLLVRLAAAAAEQWRRDRRDGRVRVPHGLAMVPFWGAPPAAVLTVGAGALLAGRHLLGETPALVVALTLWAVGTAGGLASLAAIPLRLIFHPERRLEAIFATWLLPVIPPMVSAMTGAAMLLEMPAGAPRVALLIACCAQFALSLAAVIATKVALGRRLLAHGAGPSRMLPTLFIVLGPLGTSIGAACLLAAAAPTTVGGPFAHGLETLSLAYGLPVWTAAMAWLAVAATLVLRAAARGELPFAATWWSFIFPIGTCVIGTSELALRTGAAPFQWASVALFALLLTAFAIVSGATARHAVWPRVSARRAQRALA